MLRYKLAAELAGSVQREYISHRRAVIMYFVTL